MHVKRKYIFFLCTLIATIALSITALPVISNNAASNDADLVIDIKEPESSDININHIQFIQSGNHSFIYDESDLSQNYFKTGEGPFTIRYYLTAQIPDDERLRIVLQGFDPSYHSTLHLDMAMMDELPSIIQAIVGLIDYAEIALHSTSRNEVEKIFSRGDHTEVTGEGYYVYEWTPALDAKYKYESRIYLGEFDLTEVIEILGLEDLVVDFLPDLYPTETLQNIKYNVINNFAIMMQKRSWFGLGPWTNIDNGVSINGKDYTTLDIAVKNEDLTAPTYIRPQASQESVVDDWEVKILIEDDFEGSGIKNDSVHIEYSVNGGTWARIVDPMLLGDDGIFYGTLPSQLAGSEIQYRIVFSDRAGNEVTTKTYTFWANPLEIAPIAVLLVGIAVATVATVVATRIYRNRHQPRVITLPKKKSVDKYYKKVSKEGGKI